MRRKAGSLFVTQCPKAKPRDGAGEKALDGVKSRVDHGYAVTSHSSQGLTAERVLVHADTSVHPDLLNSRFGYVSISRASREATLFTNDMAKLGPQLGADVSKTSALEVSHSSCIGLGFRMTP
jgi:hypothetical protein